MTSGVKLTERLSDATRDFFLALPPDDQATVAECIRYIDGHPDPDGVKIYDTPIMTPIMFRTAICDGFLITFRVQDGKALIYTIVRD